MYDFKLNGGIIIINQNSDNNTTLIAGNVEDGVTVDGLEPKKVEDSNKYPEQVADSAGQVNESSGMKKIPRIFPSIIISIAILGFCFILAFYFIKKPEALLEYIEWMLQQR